MRSSRLPAAAVLAAAVLAAVPAADAAVGAGSYKGKTDQNRSVTFKVKKGKVVGFQAGVMTFCNTMGANRFETDAIANVPAMKVKGNGRFKWSGDLERDGTITMAVSGRITGSKAKGTLTLSRPDSNYDMSEGMTYFGACSANDRAWTAKLR
jgi:hypothetical protein